MCRVKFVRIVDGVPLALHLVRSFVTGPSLCDVLSCELSICDFVMCA